MSALPLKADMLSDSIDVRYVGLSVLAIIAMAVDIPSADRSRRHK